MGKHDLMERAKSGDYSAQFELAKTLVEGDNPSRDFAVAVSWLEKALGANNPAYEFYLGILLCWEPPPLGDFARGFGHVLKAAELGLAEAQYFAGAELAVGDNVPKDAVKAAYWYGLAAKQGHLEALYNLAVMHEEGDGVAQDSSKAFHYLEAAGTRGEELAMKALAAAYANGSFGRSIDPEAAAFWMQALKRPPRSEGRE